MDKYMLAPKPDITAYELALIWQACQMELSRHLFDQLPPEAQRHFELSTYNFGMLS